MAGFSPPVASRAYGYAGLTLYEAVVPGMGDHQSLAGQLQGLTTLPQPESGKAYNWAVSANAAQAAIIRSLYPKTSDVNKATIDSLEKALLTQFNDADKTSNQRSAAFGRKIAETLYDYSKTDGGHESYSTNIGAKCERAGLEEAVKCKMNNGYCTMDCPARYTLTIIHSGPPARYILH